MEKLVFYTAPWVEMVAVEVERGFAASNGNDGGDVWNPGGTVPDAGEE